VGGVRREQLEALRRKTAASVRAQIEAQTSARLGELLAAKTPAKELPTRMRAAVEGAHWRVVRAVRTEAAFAVNTAQADAIREAACEVPGLKQRWTELGDDFTGRPLDKKVGKDSIALHGQVAAPGESFVMPPDGPAWLAGKTWPYPPNRPNDRAVLLPWMPGWGIPGWVWRGRRVPLT
jgi:hypothetical protein